MKKKLQLSVIASIFMFCCSSPKELQPNNNVLYQGFCRHTQTISSIYFYTDSTYIFNNGVFWGVEQHKGVYSINTDTIFIESDSIAASYFKSGLLIKKKSITDLNEENKHNHEFKFSINVR